ncbi:hypothetical protein T440DRAFT_502096 [Plenodomus tracheiphilus IPT5]|uniref:Uncharacterized protein n=1 Tax=Plenodomus tracheiphilus IPT5 TaxID=1408161 RepID=A0A6A7AUV5_9PLEO|nr:hypothetical protein T440DRAFT_502096 [Plenodomus tracheiphilus IPT5]
MGALLSLPITLLNFLLPFTKPGTPLTQDLLHTAVLCGTLYFAPQIAEWHNTQQSQGTTTGNGDEQPYRIDGEDTGTEEPPLDERFILRDDGDGNDLADPPPLAPTPPPDHARNAPNNHQPHIADENEDPNDFAGPANPPNPNAPRPTPANRTIGAKKAKSLARKDQRRAYHEFHRQEAELRRLQEAEGAEEREAALQASRDRRAAIEETIREKEREERERVKKEREREALEEAERRERVVRVVGEEVRGGGCCDLVDVAYREGKDRVWVEKLVRASGLMGGLQREGGHVMVTESGWIVRIDEGLMERVYRDAQMLGDAKEGKVSFAEFGGVLEKAVLARAKA